MLDDNGDGKGTPADWFQGTRVVKQSREGQVDGLVANQVFLVRRGVEARLSDGQRKQRDELEIRVEALRSKKKSMSEDAYYDALETIMVELAQLYKDSSSE